jgi:hypothetical protein
MQAITLTLRTQQTAPNGWGKTTNRGFDMDKVASDYTGTSTWLRGSTGISNQIVRGDMELSRKRESSRIGKMRHPSGNQLQRIPPVWDSLGKRVSAGNIIESGKFLEVWLSIEPFNIGGSEGGEKAARPGKEPESVDAMKRRVNNRARKQIRRIVNANNFQAMHTLTIALPSDENNIKYQTVTNEMQKQYPYVRGLFKKFIQRLKRETGLNNIPYLVVFELHDSSKTCPEKRGTWHIHMCTGVGHELAESISSVWWHGITDYQDFRYTKTGERRDVDICNPGAYVAEYIGKEGAQFGSEELISKKRYTTARCNKKPIKRSLEGADVGGTFELMTYNGKLYRQTLYSCITIPGTKLSSHNAHYVEVQS